MIMQKRIKDLQTQKEYYLYVYFKNKNYLKNCLYLKNNHFNEIVNYIVENNIKYLKKIIIIILLSLIFTMMKEWKLIIN